MSNHSPDSATLAHLPLFHGLEAPQYAWLRERLRYRMFAEGVNIILAEQPGEVVYVILTGTVKIHIEQADGTDVILAILGPGDTVGEMSLIDSAGRSASALTLEETEVLWMDRADFGACLKQIPEVTMNLVRVLSARVRLANELIQSLATLDVYGRVARQLLAFAAKHGQPGPDGCLQIRIRLTQGDIADLVGASRKRVNQVMVAFKQHEYISVDPQGRVTVLDQAALASFADRRPSFPSRKA